MKNLKFLAPALAFFGLMGCSDGPNSLNGMGTVQLHLEADLGVVINPAAGKTLPTVDVSTFVVMVLNEKNEVVKKYSKYSDVPQELTIEEGQYTIVAENDGVKKGAAFDKPYYSGSTPFTVKVGEAISVKVVCQLRSTGIAMSYSDYLLSSISDVSSVVSVNSGGVLLFPTDEKRTGWFAVPENGEMTIEVKGTYKGKPISKIQKISRVLAREVRRIEFDINLSGSSGVDISIDETIVYKDMSVTLPGLDDVIDNDGDTGG